MTFSCSTYLDDMPGTLVVPLVVITECIIFTGCWVLIEVRPRVEAKAQLEQLGEVWGRLELMLEYVGG